MAVQWPLLVFSVLLGITSGIFVFLAIGELTGKFRAVRFAGAVIALACLAVGGCVSVLHMGHPERAFHLLGNLGSGLSKELFAVAIMGVIALAYMVLTRKDYPGASKAFGIAGGIMGLVLSPMAGASYLIAARPAWDSLTLPLMYLGAGLAFGFLLMAALVLRRAEGGDEGVLALKLALVGVVIMAVTAAAYVVWIAVAPHQAASRSVARLFSGDLAVLFWVCAVAVGVVAPVVLAVLAHSKGGSSPREGTVLPNAKTLSSYLIAAFVCTAVGAVAIRVIMYAVGTSVEQFIYR